jgi:hypothetical protein
LKKVEPYLTAPLLVFGFTLLKARIKLVQTQ